MINYYYVLRGSAIAIGLTIQFSYAQYLKQDFFSLYNQLQQKNLIADTSSTRNSNYIQIETASNLCFSDNHKAIDHTDHLIHILGNRAPKRIGEVYNLDTHNRLLAQHGIRTRIRAWINKNRQPKKTSLTFKFNSEGIDFKQHYASDLLSIDTSTHEQKHELGIDYPRESSMCLLENLWNTFSSSSTYSLKYEPGFDFLPYTQTKAWKNTLASTNHESRFTPLSSLLRDLPFSEIQEQLLHNELIRNNLDLDVSLNTIGFVSAFDLMRWSLPVDENNLIKLDIDQKTPFYPQKKDTRFEISFKIKAHKEHLNPKILLNLLNLAIEYKSNGKLKACPQEEAFSEYIYL
ncbi:hypothetical protein MRY82_02050 [bacterium]|nr:hypothetical protein [bacterium]